MNQITHYYDENNNLIIECRCILFHAGLRTNLTKEAQSDKKAVRFLLSELEHAIHRTEFVTQETHNAITRLYEHFRVEPPEDRISPMSRVRIRTLAKFYESDIEKRPFILTMFEGNEEFTSGIGMLIIAQVGETIKQKLAYENIKMKQDFWENLSKETGPLL